MINASTPLAFIGDWVNLDGQMMTTSVGAEIHFITSNTDELIIDWPNHANSNSLPQVIAVKIDDGQYSTYPLGDVFKIDLENDDAHAIRIIVQGNARQADFYDGDEDFRLNKIYSNHGNIYPGFKEDKLKDNLVFVGDSITIGSKVDEEFLGPQNNHAESNYPIQVSDYFNLNNIRIGYGGTGITSKAAIYPPSAIEFIWKLKRDVARPLHDGQNTRAVIVNIGTNDHAASEQEFAWSLRTFTIELTKRFHNAPIYIMIPFNQQFADVFKSVITEFSEISLIETVSWNLTYSDGLHPNQNGHDIAARELIKVLKEYGFTS